MSTKTQDVPELSDLSSVAVVDFSRASEIELHRKALVKNGALMLENNDIKAVETTTRQKIAIILDETIPSEEIHDIIEEYESCIDQNPEKSLRIFYLHWLDNGKQPSHIDCRRLQCINAMQTSASAFPAEINHFLYEARLPLWLREEYDIDISPELEKIGAIMFRPITIRKYLPSELERSLEYSDYKYIYSDKESDRWIYCINSGSGRIEKMNDWDPEIVNNHQACNIGRNAGMYHKNFSHFYRIMGGGETTEIQQKNTQPGKLDYISHNLYIHNKHLYQKTDSGSIIEIDENGSIPVKKEDGSKSFPFPLKNMMLESRKSTPPILS